MEWYNRNGGNEVVVPRDQGVLDTFQSSQNRWMHWGSSAGGNFNSLDKSFDFQHKDFDTLRDDLEMDFMVGESDQLETSGVRGGISESSSCWTTLTHNQDYHQVDGIRGTNQTDENFVNSLLVDEMRSSEQFHCYGSPKSQGEYSASGLTNDMLLELHDIGTSKHFEAEGFPCSLDWENIEADTGHYGFTNMTNNAVPQFVAPLENVQVRPEQVCADDDMGNMVSAEESVLHELDNVMQKMTDRTRLCFRDALYRLANDSGKQANIQSQHRDNNALERPSRTAFVNRTFRSVDNKNEAPETEKRSNAIDRTVADLMFGNPCSSIHTQHYTVSPYLNQGSVSPAAVKPHDSSYNSNSNSNTLNHQLSMAKMQFLLSTPDDDAEVPTFTKGVVPVCSRRIRNAV